MPPGPLPREPRQVPSQSRAARYCFWRAQKSVRRPSAHPGFLPEAIRFPLRPYIEARSREVRAGSRLCLRSPHPLKLPAEVRGSLSLRLGAGGGRTGGGSLLRGFPDASSSSSSSSARRARSAPVPGSGEQRGGRGAGPPPAPAPARLHRRGCPRSDRRDWSPAGRGAQRGSRRGGEARVRGCARARPGALRRPPPTLWSPPPSLYGEEPESAAGGGAWNLKRPSHPHSSRPECTDSPSPLSSPPRCRREASRSLSPWAREGAARAGRAGPGWSRAYGAGTG